MSNNIIFPNLVPRALFPGFGGGAGKAREKRPGDEVAYFPIESVTVAITG